MHYIKYNILLILLILQACTNGEISKTAESNITIIGTASFPINFGAQQGKFCGSFIDHGTEYIYFAEPVTSKSISIFDEETKLVHKIDLSTIIDDFSDEPEEISVVNMDTIIILFNWQQKVVFIDKEANIFKTIDLNNRTSDASGIKFELSSSMYSVRQNPNHLFYAVTLLYSPENNDKNQNSRSKEFKEYMIKSRDPNVPYGLIINELDEISHGMIGFYHSLIGNAELLPFFLFYSIKNDMVSICSIFSDKIYSYDLKKPN